MSWAITSKVDIGVLINPGHPEVGIPITPPVFKLFRDAVEERRPPLNCVADYPMLGEKGVPWAPSLAADDPVHQLMARFGAGDESLAKPVFSALANSFLTLPLKEYGRLDSAFFIRVQGVSYPVAFTRPEFIDTLPAAKHFPYRAQMTLKQLCSHFDTKTPALSLNSQQSSAVVVIPRLFPQLLAVVASTPPPFVLRKPSLPPLPPIPGDNNPIHQAIQGIKAGDKAQIFHLFDALATTPVYLTLAEPDKMETCGAILIDGDTCLTIFTA